MFSPLRAHALALVGLSVALAGCGPEAVSDAGSTSSIAAPACDADDPSTFCDDCNPCTADANCTPCSAIPHALRDIHHCSDDLPPFCDGITGCAHVPITAPAGQINDCFPVAGDPDLHAGVCAAGTCVENER